MNKGDIDIELQTGMVQQHFKRVNDANVAIVEQICRVQGDWGIGVGAIAQQSYERLVEGMRD